MPRGRKRKQNARRKPSGNTADPTVAEIKEVARIQRYKRDLMRNMDDPRREGPLGDAFICGHIDETDMEAGRIYATLVRRYASILNIPMAPPKTSAFERQYGITLRPDIPPDVAGKIKTEYNLAFEVLSGLGRSTVTEINRVCVYSEPVNDGQGLKRGLSKLCEHFGLAGRSTEHGGSRIRKLAQKISA